MQRLTSPPVYSSSTPFLAPRTSPRAVLAVLIPDAVRQSSPLLRSQGIKIASLRS